MRALLLLFLCPAVLLSVLPSHAFGEKPVLRVLNWSEYIDVDDALDSSLPMNLRSPTLLRFSREFDCRVEYEEYESETDFFKKMTNLPGYYDVVISTSDVMNKFYTAKMLARLSKEHIPHLRHAMPEYASMPGANAAGYAAPYLLGSTGLAYRDDVIPGPVDSLDVFFAPDATYKVGCLDTEFSLGFALLALGRQLSTKNASELRSAANLFLELKKQGRLCVASSVEELMEKLLSKELGAALLFSGEALNLGKKDPHIRYTLPKEGAEFYIDCIGVPKDAPNKRLAFSFVNFMLTPEIHANNALYLSYMAPNEQAMELVAQQNPDYRDHPALNPNPEQQKSLKMFVHFHEQEVRRLWRKITR